MKTIFIKPAEVEKKWYIIDAEGKELGKVAVAAARILRGKNKPEFALHQDMGDFVIIINAAKAALSGNKYKDKEYWSHAEYIGSMKCVKYDTMIVRKPTFPLEHAIKGMLPKGSLGHSQYSKLKVYAGNEHPHMAQQPVAVEV